MMQTARPVLGASGFGPEVFAMSQATTPPAHVQAINIWPPGFVPPAYQRPTAEQLAEYDANRRRAWLAETRERALRIIKLVNQVETAKTSRGARNAEKKLLANLRRRWRQF